MPLHTHAHQICVLAAGEAAIMSASFTVEKNSSRIEVPDVFTLQRSNVLMEFVKITI